VDRAALTRLALPFAIIASIQFLNRQMGLLLTGGLLPPEQVALYRVADQFAFLIAFGAQVAGLVAQPFIAEHAQKADQRPARKLLFAGTAGLFVITALPLAVLAPAGRYILEWLYGAEFGAAYPVLLVLGLANLFNASMVFARIHLNMSGWQNRLMAIFVASLVLQAVLSTFLAGRYGMIGIAWGAAIAMAMCFAASLWQANRHTRQVPALEPR
jgi:O-antigen/teichoic acid export membrane protein